MLYGINCTDRNSGYDMHYAHQVSRYLSVIDDSGIKDVVTC